MWEGPKRPDSEPEWQNRGTEAAPTLKKHLGPSASHNWDAIRSAE